MGPAMFQEASTHARRSTVAASNADWKYNSKFHRTNASGTNQEQRINFAHPEIQEKLMPFDSLLQSEDCIGSELLSIKHQSLPEVPDIFGGVPAPAPDNKRQTEHKTNNHDSLIDNGFLQGTSSVPSVDPGAWVSKMMSQFRCDAQKQKQAEDYLTKDDGDENSVVFFHNSSFEPVEPPWRNPHDNDLDMQVEETPFPNDPDFSMDCFDFLKDDPQLGETLPCQAGKTPDDGPESPFMTLLSDGDEPTISDIGMQPLSSIRTQVTYCI